MSETTVFEPAPVGEPTTAPAPPHARAPRRSWLAVLAVVAAVVAAFIPSPASSAIFHAVLAGGAFLAVLGSRVTVSFYAELAARVRFRREEPVRHHRLTAAPGLVFCGMLALILLGVLFWPVEEIAKYNTALTTLGALFTLTLLPPLYHWSSVAGRWLQASRAWVRLTCLGVFLVVAFLVQLRVGYALQVNPGWDVGGILESAFGVADGSKPTFYDFFATYPNNLMLTVGLTHYSQLMLALGVPSSGLLYAAVVLNCIVLNCTVLLTYLCARHLINEGAAVFTLLPSTLFVVFSPYISVVYTDSLGILFPVLLLYLHLKAVAVSRAAAKASLWVLLGAAAAVGYNLKPTVLFAFIAILAVYVLERVLARRGLKRTVAPILAVLLCAGAGFGGAHLAIWADVKSQPYLGFDVSDNSKTFPWTHFLAMGATGMGAFTQSDVLATQAIQDPQARYQHGLDLYMERVQDMGYPGYLQFLDHKAVWTFGDGSFHSWGEGPLLSRKDPFPVKDPLSDRIKGYLWGNGDEYAVTTGIWQSLWLALLVLVAVPLRVRSPRLLSGSAAIMRWALLALTLFLLLFETRSRYLYLYLPYFALLATLTLDTLISRRHGGPGRVDRRAPERVDRRLPSTPAS